MGNRDWKKGANRSPEIVHPKGLRGGTFGPAGPAVSLMTGAVYWMDNLGKIHELAKSPLAQVAVPEVGTEGSPIFLRNCGPRNASNLPPPWC